MRLFADRLFPDEMKDNQLRLYFSALAYTLMEALRRLGLKGTEWPRLRSIPSASSCSRSAPSSGSAWAASSSNSVRPIPGKTPSHRPSTLCVADHRNGCQQSNLATQSSKAGGAMPDILLADWKHPSSTPNAQIQKTNPVNAPITPLKCCFEQFRAAFMRNCG